MTAKEAYESVDSNYDNVLKRLGSEAMIKRFAVNFWMIQHLMNWSRH